MGRLVFIFLLVSLSSILTVASTNGFPGTLSHDYPSRSTRKKKPPTKLVETTNSNINYKDRKEKLEGEKEYEKKEVSVANNRETESQKVPTRNLDASLSKPSNTYPILKTLKKLQAMLDDTDYATTAPRKSSNLNDAEASDFLKTNESQKSESIPFKNESYSTKDSPQSSYEILEVESESMSDIDINVEKENRLWTSKDRSKYRKKQRLQQQEQQQPHIENRRPLHEKTQEKEHKQQQKWEKEIKEEIDSSQHHQQQYERKDGQETPHGEHHQQKRQIAELVSNPKMKSSEHFLQTEMENGGSNSDDDVTTDDNESFDYILPNLPVYMSDGGDATDSDGKINAEESVPPHEGVQQPPSNPFPMQHYPPGGNPYMTPSEYYDQYYSQVAAGAAGTPHIQWNQHQYQGQQQQQPQQAQQQHSPMPPIYYHPNGQMQTSQPYYPYEYSYPYYNPWNAANTLPDPRKQQFFYSSKPQGAQGTYPMDFSVRNQHAYYNIETKQSAQSFNTNEPLGPMPTQTTIPGKNHLNTHVEDDTKAASLVEAGAMIAFDSIQKLAFVVLGSSLLAYCAVSPRSLPLADYNMRFKENLQILSLLVIAPILVTSCVFDARENDLNTYISTFYTSFTVGYILSFILEVILTTFVRLAAFALWEGHPNGIFELTPDVPFLILPWVLREKRYRPKRITLFAADFASSCIVSPIVEEYFKMQIVRWSVRLPKNFQKKVVVKNKRKYRKNKRSRITMLEPIRAARGEEEVTNINSYVTYMLASSHGLKLADSMRRILMYTKQKNTHKSFYALCRGIFPIHELCGTMTSIELAKRDVLGMNLPLWRVLLPAVFIHGMANFRGMKPIFKWNSSTPWSEMQLSQWNMQDNSSLSQLLSKSFAKVVWLSILFRVLGYCVKNYYLTQRKATKRATLIYAGKQSAFSGEMVTTEILKKSKKDQKKKKNEES